MRRQKSQSGLQLTRAFCSQASTHWDLVLLATAAYDGLSRGGRSGLMVYYDEAGAQYYLYGGVDRMRANVAVSQAAYAEASKRTARDRSLAPARMSLAQAVRQERRKSQRVEMSAD